MEYLFFVVCLTAAVTDFFWKRIPNFWLGSWFLTGLLLAGLGKGSISEAASATEFLFRHPWSWQAEICYLGRAASVYLLLAPAWRLRMIGAGDVKLCSVMAAFLGFEAFCRTMLCSLALGGILSLTYMIVTKSFQRRFGAFLAWFRRCISCERWIPYRKERDMDGTIPFAPVVLAGYLACWRFG